MIVIPPTPDEAAGHVADMYDGDLRTDGFVFSHTQAMAINPEAHQAFEALIRAIVPSIGVRTYELATLGAARAIPSPHCLLAHGRKALRAEALTEEQLERVARRDYETAGLDDADVAVMRFAEKLSTDAARDDGRGFPVAAGPRVQRSADRRHRTRCRGAQLLQPGAAGAGGAGRRRAGIERGADGGAAVARLGLNPRLSRSRRTSRRSRSPPDSTTVSRFFSSEMGWRVGRRQLRSRHAVDRTCAAVCQAQRRPSRAALLRRRAGTPPV